MFYSDIEKRIQERYPMIFFKWNGYKKATELWEDYGEGKRFLWTYKNPDGTHQPVIYDRAMEWLQRADTRNWNWQNKSLFREIMRQEKEESEAAKKDFNQKIQDRVLEDYNYIRGIKTFFMDPSSMPQRVSTYIPGQEKILKQAGVI